MKQQTPIDFLLSHIPELGKDMIGRDIISEAKGKEKQAIADAFEAGQMKEAKQEFWTGGTKYFDDKYNQP